ncbi:MotA/TolQ/ExbB proton channel family protein [Pseudodesulfovibrio sediminis]|uniref:Biopolymer transporter TonB n=1 Tax=Pseudodesulfovibrio sediminis TaxID=2810563 RepID=A0ABM7P5F4_9BACT|nr:MotA/TolQ/ExbB proton channel family protein [Pseudodesulfovibrio sediminis]BCS88078.1 biopolymer transporter TonB [Pseudodesulfovibrio sediminis]
MRRIAPLARLCLFFALTLCVPSGAWAADGDAPAALSDLARAMDARTHDVNALLDLDAEQLRSRVAALRAALSAEEARLDTATAKLKKLRAQKAALTREYDEAAADMRSVEDTVRTNTAQTLTLLTDSATTSLIPSRLQPLEALADSRAFPGIPAITTLGALLLDEIHSGATAQVTKSTFLGPDGTTRSGLLLRGGALFLGATEDGNAFLLTPGSTPPQAVAVTPGQAQDEILSWVDDAGIRLPLDPAHGAALSLLQARRTLADWMQGGGMLLWPILAAGFLALLVIAYKAARLLNARPSPKDFSLQLGSAWESGGWDAVTGLLHSLPRVPAARVLLWATPGGDVPQCDKQLQEGFLFEIRRLESMLGFIAVMAAIAPLLGLLGTVTGMIDSFQAITIFGTANPRIMSSGISEALITTQAGLGVAIPVIVMHHFLKQRVQTLAGDMEQLCAALLALLPSDSGDAHE